MKLSNFGFAEQKRRILNEIRGALVKFKEKDPSGIIDYEKMKAQLIMRYGLTDKKMSEYFEEIKKTGLIRFKEDYIEEDGELIKKQCIEVLKHDVF